MKFEQDDLRLQIKSYDDSISFKAYLEESDVSFDIIDIQLPFSPTNFKNQSIADRVNQKAKFTFNVFSEDRSECINNYLNLQKLLFMIKPLYFKHTYEVLPSKNNTLGYLSIKFNGLPYDKNEINIHLKNFSYEINKELGYIQVPRKELKDLKSEKSFFDNDMKLIPISYKISLEAKIILPLTETLRISNDTSFSKLQKTKINSSVNKTKIVDTSGTSTFSSLGLSQEQSALAIYLSRVFKYEDNINVAYEYQWKAIAQFVKSWYSWFNIQADGSFIVKPELRSQIITLDGPLTKLKGEIK